MVSQVYRFDTTRWKLTGTLCLFLCCCCICCTSHLFSHLCCFFYIFSSLPPSTFHCPWLSRWLSNTSKGKVCGAADNTLHPQASASFSRAPTQSLNWQVWSFLCLVGNCFFADVSSALFSSSSRALWVQFQLFSRAPGFNVHLNCVISLQH